MRKMHWLAQGLRKVKFRWNQVSLWQHRILRETFLNLGREVEKILTLVVCFLLPLKRERKKCLTLAACFPWPPCLLPSHLKMIDN